MVDFPPRLRSAAGWLMLLAGVSVFAIRLQHAGPYAFPERGNLLAGVLALGIGAALVRPWLGSHRLAPLWTGALLLAAPIVLFFALYATLAELEEVVVLRVTDARGHPAALRLWVVDSEGAMWVTMPRAKADAHGLSQTRAELLRRGQTSCVMVTREAQHAKADQIFRLRYEKYRIQRLATAIGVFGRAASDDTVTLRLDPCAPG